jgi:hypothetical protein
MFGHIDPLREIDRHVGHCREREAHGLAAWIANRDPVGEIHARFGEDAA